MGKKKSTRKGGGRLWRGAASLRVGSTDDFGNYYGPVIDSDNHQRLLNILWDHSVGKQIGGRRIKLLLDGRDRTKKPWQGYFIGPSIFEVTDPKDPLFQEETFGPILSVTRAEMLDKAIALARDSMFNLTGAALTRSPRNLEVLEKNWQGVGNLYLLRHQTGAVVDRQPFGGNNLSGIGGSKAGGRDYLWQFVDVERKEKTLEQAANYVKAFLRTKLATKARMEKPDVYQPNLLGETNKVVYRPRGKGWIIIGKETLPAEAAALLSAAIYSGNEVLVTAVQERLSLMQDLARYAHLQDDQPKVKITTGLHPTATGDLEKLATDPEVKWVAFGGKNQVEPEIVKMAAKTPKGQNFVRVIIAEDPLAVSLTHGGVNPGIFAGMTVPQTVTTNTARHSFDAKKAMEGNGPPPPPKPTGGGGTPETPSSSGPPRRPTAPSLSSRPRESTRQAGIQHAASKTGSPLQPSARGGDDNRMRRAILRAALRHNLKDVARYVAGLSENQLRAFAASAPKNWARFLEANGFGSHADQLKAAEAHLKATDTLLLTLAAMADSRRDVEQVLSVMTNEGRLNSAGAPAPTPALPPGIALPALPGTPSPVFNLLGH